MNHLIRDEIRQLKAYDAQHSFEGVKLDAMESPWSAIDFTDAELITEIQKNKINLYPDPYQSELRQTVAEYFSLNTDELLFGNGSDELIVLIMMAIGRVRDTILSVNPTFSVYQIQAIANQRRYISVPLRADFSLNVEHTIKQIQEHQPIITFIAYPNNPTGNCFERADIEKIIQATNGLVVLDEAYYAFARDQGFLQSIQKYENLLVMRTFSKVGFAGLRVGLLVGHQQWLSQINKVRLPYNINTLSQSLLSYALKTPQCFEDRARLICKEREKLYSQLQALSADLTVKVYPSDANFLLFKIVDKTRDIDENHIHQLALLVHQELKKQGILIRCLSTPNGLLNGCLRVSIGTCEENQIFLQILKQIMIKFCEK
jgi:histidinol-phosphate aminotransferase